MVVEAVVTGGLYLKYDAGERRGGPPMPGPDPKADRVQVINVFREADVPALTAKEVAEELPVEKRTVHKYLDRLHEQERLGKKSVGTNGVVWWLKDDNLTDIDLPYFEIDDRVGSWLRKKHKQGEYERIQYHWPPQLSISEYSVLFSIDIPGPEAREHERRRAILHAYLYLRMKKAVSKRKFIDTLYSWNQAGYANSNAWWERLIREGLKEFPPVNKPYRGGEWKYIHDDDFVSDQSFTRETVDLTHDKPLTEKIDRPPRKDELIHLILMEWYSGTEDPEDTKKKFSEGKRALSWLRACRGTSYSDFVDKLFPESSIDDETRWWSEYVRPIIETASRLGYVDYCHDGYVARLPE